MMQFILDHGLSSKEIVGLVAAALGTISFVPQVIKIWKTRSVKDISYAMYVMYTTSLILWLIYGIMIKSIPIILAESLQLILVFMILVMKYMWK
jgi:MtN3 and saliva related transmembrane protein